MKRTTLKEWQEEARARFGEDSRKWKFRCPACGHEQSIQDFWILGQTQTALTRAVLAAVQGKDPRWKGTALAVIGRLMAFLELWEREGLS